MHTQGLLKESMMGDKTEGAIIDQEDKIKKLNSIFKDDEEYKMKMATEHDMLSYVGSEIDEVKMDHLSFY